MKQLLPIVFLFASFLTLAQTGEVSGVILDANYNDQPLPFADVYLKGTTNGVTTDFDGKYTLSAPAGQQTIIITFIGYETKEEVVNVVAGQTTTLNVTLSGDLLEEVVVTAAPKVKETEAALVQEQKEAVVIKESVGAIQLAKQAVSDAAAATSKISGVTKTENGGDVYIRGLGDRYLSTTLNGLPVPSDDVERKNIDLGLFPTNIIQNVGISKTYDPSLYADQASGNVDVVTKVHSGQRKISISGSVGGNTNVWENGVFTNFRQSQNTNNTTLGFYNSDLNNKEALLQESWNTTRKKTPINAGISASYGESFFGNKLAVFTTASHSVSYNERIGEFAAYKANIAEDTIFDAQRYSTKINTTALATAEYKINGNHKIKGNAIFINKSEDQVNEFGRNGRGVFFEEVTVQQNRDGIGQFVRDQNLKQTTINIYQLLSEHKFSDKDILKLGGGYNFIDAREPNRIRNEVNIFGENDIRFGNTGSFQQRKTAQVIQDTEWNAFAKYTRDIIETDKLVLKANIGANYRNKQRKFDSRFEGLRINPLNRGFSTNSFDNLDEAFTEQNVGLGVFLIPNGVSGFYDGELLSKAGFISADIKFADIVSAKIGARYEDTDLNLPIWDFPNANPLDPTSSFNSNKNFLPSFTVKVDVLDNLAIKAAASKTITLQEFKELAPFDYVSPNGRITTGNDKLQSSKNLNGDLKIEFYPKDGQLISLTGFAKQIKDPINKVLVRGSSGKFTFFNTSEEANIKGLEFEARLDLFDLTDQAKLSTNFNLTRMWHKQDLKVADDANEQNEDFRYGNKTEIGLQGASDWIVNGSLTFSNNKENEFLGTLTANYSSDKILALGRANEQANFRTEFNNEIIEKGFLTIDMVLSKKFNEHLTVKLINKNLINPEIKQTQLIEPPTTSSSSEETVLSFRKGRSISLGLSYKF